MTFYCDERGNTSQWTGGALSCVKAPTKGSPWIIALIVVVAALLILLCERFVLARVLKYGRYKHFGDTETVSKFDRLVRTKPLLQHDIIRPLRSIYSCISRISQGCCRLAVGQ